MMTGSLVLLRHGESETNRAGVFTGLLDAPLTGLGERQARRAGHLLRAAGLVPDVILTSTLQRAVRTAELVIDALDIDVPLEKIWQLNERNYGELTGVAKTDARQTLGDIEYLRLRRSREGRPAKMSLRLWVRLRCSPPLRALPTNAVRRTEALSDVITRLSPVLERRILPSARRGNVLVVAHGNSLRAVSACIDKLTDDELSHLNLPTGQPLRYRTTSAGAFTPRGGEYLDPEAHQAAALIAAEGGT